MVGRSRAKGSFSTFMCPAVSPLAYLLSVIHVKTKRYRKAKAQQTNQLHPGQLFFSREEEEIRWVGFEPTTLCSLGKRSTN